MFPKIVRSGCDEEVMHFLKFIHFHVEFQNLIASKKLANNGINLDIVQNMNLQE